MRILLLVFLLAGTCVRAQDWQARVQEDVTIGDTSQVHQIIMQDYGRMLGVVLAIEGDSILLQVPTIAEAVRIPTSEMRYIAVTTPPRRRRLNSNRAVPLGDMTLFQTALPFPGRREFKTVMLLFNTVSWRVNDELQFGVGLSGPLGVQVDARYRISLSRWVHVGVSNRGLFLPVVAATGGTTVYLGNISGLLTLGTSDQFFTAGVGTFYGPEQNTTRNYRIGVGTRLGGYTHLYGEILSVAGSEGNRISIVPTVCLALNRRNHRWTFGVASYFIDDEFTVPVPIPVVSYALYF